MPSLAPFVLKLRLSLDQQRQRRLACSEYRCDGVRCVTVQIIASRPVVRQMHVIDSSWACETSYDACRDLSRYMMAPVFEIRLFALSVAFVERACSRLSIVRFANGPKRSMGHLPGAKKINFFNSRF